MKKWGHNQKLHLIKNLLRRIFLKVSQAVSLNNEITKRIQKQIRGQTFYL